MALGSRKNNRSQTRAARGLSVGNTPPKDTANPFAPKIDRKSLWLRNMPTASYNVSPYIVSGRKYIPPREVKCSFYNFAPERGRHRRRGWEGMGEVTNEAAPPQNMTMKTIRLRFREHLKLLTRCCCQAALLHLAFRDKPRNPR